MITRGAARLVPLFLVGILFYQYRERIPYRLGYALAAIAAYVALAAFGSPEWMVNPVFSFVTAPLFAYVVNYAGLSDRFVFKPLSRGDYSYGIYLYGYPLQQTLIQTLPWIDNRAAFFALSVAAASRSWRRTSSMTVSANVRRSLRSACGTSTSPVRTLRVKANSSTWSMTRSRNNSCRRERIVASSAPGRGAVHCGGGQCEGGRSAIA